MAAPLGAEKRSSMSEFTTQQKLGSGSYGNVFKVLRKADGQLCVQCRAAFPAAPLSLAAPARAPEALPGRALRASRSYFPFPSPRPRAATPSRR
jgi:hypothetical protein